MRRVSEMRPEVSLPVDENDVLFDDTAGAYDYGSCDGEYGRLRVYDSTYLDFSA